MLYTVILNVHPVSGTIEQIPLHVTFEDTKRVEKSSNDICDCLEGHQNKFNFSKLFHKHEAKQAVDIHSQNTHTHKYLINAEI